MIQHKVIFPVKECCITADKSVVTKGAKKGPQWCGEAFEIFLILPAETTTVSK